ncbi:MULTISPECIES: 2-hydroxy-3-oxopropionate reductase [unclassified Mycobacterium]|uniref:2-hydroxy-3-oxopropionate reductase n=1 Tax=unclassified Mycobacterium TaxID=2642494 RepID=UPI00048E6C6F|nr:MULTISPECIES: 2-hydroxy-3-oxopropionate reductase [unclassified Mycobacterium]SEB25215.1 2-hydroxy-3-oxopropionate reductase [Mycobacterium sp. 283mftsu]
MSAIAFIGLGIMGSPMAVNLVRAGHHVTGYNRSPHRVADLVAAGGKAADSVADAVNDADIVALMLPDSPDVEAVLTTAGGVFGGARAGALIIDFSSIRPDVAAALSRQARERHLRMLDAPVSGGQRGAIDGNLSIMVGGTPEDFAGAKPVLHAVGSEVVHVGPSGSGQTVKAANQLIVAGNIELLAEAIVFLEAHNVDTHAAMTVLGGGLAGSAVLEQKGQNMLRRSFAPGFRIDLHHKDLGIFAAAARDAGIVSPMGAVVAQLMAAARANGDGGLDHAALLRGVERLCGRHVADS